MLLQCCECKRYRVADEWRHLLRIPSSSVSHTYCPKCYEKAFARIKLQQALSQLQGASEATGEAAAG